MITFHVLSACIKEKNGVVDDEEPIEVYQAVNTPLLAIPLPYICLRSILQIRLLGNSCLVKQIWKTDFSNFNGIGRLAVCYCFVIRFARFVTLTRHDSHPLFKRHIPNSILGHPLESLLIKELIINFNLVPQAFPSRFSAWYLYLSSLLVSLRDLFSS